MLEHHNDVLMKNARILVVEDDDELRSALSDSLALEGYRVSTASNGLEALKSLREGPSPQLILLDLMMPVMNGWQFRSAQKDDPSLAAIPVIVLSAVGNHVQKIEPLDAVAFMRKPFDLELLLQYVDRYAKDDPATAPS